MKDAFNALGIEGSGHRLRVHYATATAARLRDECFAINGYRFDQTVVNMALDRLAEALGHSKVTTTVRYHLDMALLRHFGAASREKLDAVRLVWNAVVRRQGSLSEEKMRLILRVVDGLATAPDGSGLQDVIVMALDDPDLNPPSKAPPHRPGRSRNCGWSTAPSSRDETNVMLPIVYHTADRRPVIGSSRATLACRRRTAVAGTPYPRSSTGTSRAACASVMGALRRRGSLLWISGIRLRASGGGYEVGFLLIL